VHDTFLVELDSYGGNGECQCEDFTMRMEPLLRRGITAEQALTQKLIRLREGQEPEDALRCWHIRHARSQFCDDVIAAMAQKEQHADTPF